jgi:type IV secretion system protein VirB10
MNAHTPNTPHGDADPHNQHNPYRNRYQQAEEIPDLDTQAPHLPHQATQRLNRKAALFASAIVVLAALGGTWVYSISKKYDEPAQKTHQETVTVPEAPRLMPAASPKQQAAPIALAAAPPLPDPRAMPLPVAPSVPSTPSLLERRMMSAESSSQSGNTTGPQATSSASASDATSARPLNNPDTLIPRGTYIRCVLESRIITDIPGFTSCVVTEPVYSFNGQRLLLPKGSKVLGKYDTEPHGPRAAVIWDRIVTPTGIDVNMASPGVDNLGGAGHPGHYSAHWGSRIGAALLISMLSDAFKYEAAVHGPTQTSISNGVVTQTPFESNTAQTVQNLANQAVRTAANKPPTVTINQGTVVNIYVAKDVDFSGVVARF